MNLSCARGLHIALAFFSIPAAAFALPPAANPIARFDTAFGSFRVELFADQAPLTVANFTNYVSSGRY